VKFLCAFTDPDDRSQNVTIPVELSANEVKAIRALRREGDPHLWVKMQAYALRHAYQMAPDGFQHTSGGVRQVLVN
jgi:hypothetical protein